MARPTALESRALLSHAEDEGWWFRAKEDIVQDLLAPHLSDRCSVLLLGGGSGGTARRLRRRAPGCTIVGLDIDPEAVALCAREDPAGRYRLADLEHDPLGSPESMDLVFALDVLEHLDRDADVLAGATRVLRAGGLLIINVPAHPWLFSEHDRHLGHRRRYRPTEIEALVRGAGLSVVRSTPLFGSALIGMYVWRRLLPALGLGRSGRSDVGLRIPRPLDALLYGMARAEGWLARWFLPFGSSQLVVARRDRAASPSRPDLQPPEAKP
jgi:SAM-dependent methyltransferase